MCSTKENYAVKIAVRERPINENLENIGSGLMTYHPKDTNNVLIVNERPFTFDAVFSSDISQEKLFSDLIKPMMEKFLEGFNCTALAYGQTGTGKTYTMGLQDSDFVSDEIGVIPRCINEVFKKSECFEGSQENFIVSASFIEIYNEKVYDLLSENPREQINIKGQKSLGSVKKTILNINEGYALLVQGNKNRRVRPTKMNSQSSRSHAVFTLHLSKSTILETRTSCFHLVDLAGSEGVRRTGHQGIPFTEGVFINQGLLSIGKVLQALVTESKVIPYRDSVLSSVLQDSLNINSYLVLLACISPHKEDLSETMSTIRFANDAKSLKNTPQINSVLQEMKKQQSKTPLKPKNGPYQTPLIYKRTLNDNQKESSLATSSLKKRPPPVHSNTFCTPLKKLIIDNKKFNQTDFGLTPKEKKRNMEVQNAKNTIFPVFSTPRVSEDALNGLNKFNDTISSSASLLSLNMSTSTLLNAPITNSYSPIIQRCMVEFENKLEDKMMKMFGAFKEMTMIKATSNNINVTTASSSNPLSFTNSNLKNELRTIVREELLSLNNDIKETENSIVQNQIENSNGLEDQSLMNNDSVFKIPQQLTIKENQNDYTALNEYDNTLNFLQDGNNTVLPKVRRSTRLSMKSNLNETSTVRRSIRLSMRGRKNENDNDKNRINLRRRSARLNSTKEISLNAPKKQHHVKKVPTQNKVIASYFENNTEEINLTQAKLRHEKAVLELLNKGSINELVKTLPQVGLKTAYQIVTYRTLNGKFKTFDHVSKAPVWRGKAWQRFKEANNIS